MHSKFLLSAAALAAPALAAPNKKFGCAAEPSESFIQAAKEMAAKEQAGTFATFTNSSKAVGPIPVHFHVVTSSEGSGPDDATLSEQFKVLQDNYAPHDVSFNFVDTSRTVNADWAKDGNELEMKSALRKGTYSELNVYFLEEVGGAFGYCHFPETTQEGTEVFNIDGCSILSSTVPGGSETNFNEGKTVTHEVGHWFGLFHTFQGGCSGEGDGIADTPAQQSPTSGCPTGRDSCPSQDGVDPIHNYMDYSYDSCYEEFTAGQAERIRNFWTQFRG